MAGIHSHFFSKVITFHKLFQGTCHGRNIIICQKSGTPVFHQFIDTCAGFERHYRKACTHGLSNRQSPSFMLARAEENRCFTVNRLDIGCGPFEKDTIFHMMRGNIFFHLIHIVFCSMTISPDFQFPLRMVNCCLFKSLDCQVRPLSRFSQAPNEQNCPLLQTAYFFTFRNHIGNDNTRYLGTMFFQNIFLGRQQNLQRCATIQSSNLRSSHFLKGPG